MSRIFDALQHSAAEESPVFLQWPVRLTELLEFTERRKAAARASAVFNESRLENTISSDAETVLISEAAVQTVTDFSVEAKSANTGASPAPFSQFQSLPLPVPPQSRLVCITDKKSLAAEKFRYLSMWLHQLRERRPIKKVLITSAVPQEGKSMVAANLACALAGRTREKVLLLDGDLQRPSLARLFDLETPTGMCEWLQGKATLSTTIYYLEAAHCWIMPAGNTSHNSLELMQSPQFPALLEQVMAWFDWIIIDSPTVLPLADTRVWIRHVDGVLMVNRQASTDEKQLQRGLDAIEPSKLLGTVLNCSSGLVDGTHYSRNYRPSGLNQRS